jgi:outer membrane protein assembly factor BamB
MKCRGVILLAVLIFPAISLAADWPHWLGPNRNGSSPEKGLLTTWPKAGPKVLWKVPGGDGYSTIAVAGGKAYTLVQRGKEELAICLDVKDGKELWKMPIAPSFKNQYGNGPRSTPTIEGDRVYVQSVSGPLVCLEAASGKIAWQHDLLKEFKAKNISWGLSASPTIDGDLVLAIPGAEGASVAAFNKKDGTLVWKSGDDAASYASPMPVTIGGQRQIIFFTATALHAVAAKDGKQLWSVPWVIEFNVNICTPLLVGMDRLFVSTGEADEANKGGCVMYQLKPDGPPGIIWKSQGPKSVMMNYWANSVLHDGRLYGMSGEFNKKIHLNCVDAATGKLIWSKQNFGKAAVTLADGHLFLVTKKEGDLVLAAASPKGYEEKGRVTLLGDNRTAATISNGRLFLRDKQNILCLDIAGAK